MQLKLSDMKSGDILLLKDWNSAKSHMGIAAFQALWSHRRNASSKITHAGLFDSDDILEASGEDGLRAMPLAQKQAGYRYLVYRTIDTQELNNEIPLIAANFARLLIEKKVLEQADGSSNFGEYGKMGCYTAPFIPSNKGNGFFTRGQGGALRAIKTLEEQPLANRKFYCSNFVVECYEFARSQVEGSEALFDVDFRHISPKVLHGNLATDITRWKKMGEYIAGS